MTLRRIGTAVFALALLLPGSAPAGAALVPGGVGNIYGLRVALADNGDAVAVWADVTDSNAPVVKAAIRPAGRGWQRPRSLSHGSNAGLPDVAVDANGNAVVVWRASVGSNDVVQEAVRRSGGAFGPPRTLAESDLSVVGSFGPPRVVVDASGRAFAVWSGGSYDDPVVQFAAGTARRGLSGDLVVAHGSSPDVAVDGRGNVTVIWADVHGIETAVRPHAGGFGPTQTLGQGMSPQIAVNARGDALVAWTSATYPQSVLAAFRPARGTFGSVETVGSAGDFAFGIRPVLDGRGTASVVWQADGYIQFPLEVAVRRPGGGFGSERKLTPDAAGFDVAAGRSGDAIVVWSRYAGDLVVQATTWASARRSFGRAHRLSEPGYNALYPTVALDGRGHGVALWARSQGHRFVLESRSTAVTTPAAPADRGPAWLAPTLLAGPGAHGERVAFDARGNATVVWATDALSDQGVVKLVSATAGGRFGTARTISPPGVWAGPALGVDPAGNATIVWASGSPPNVVVNVAVRSPSGSFGPIQALAHGHFVSAVDVDIDARGDAIATWVASDGSTYTLQAAFRPAGSTFGPPEQISPVEPYPLNPSVAINARGDVAAVWDVFLGNASMVQAAFRPANGNFGVPETIAEAAGQTSGGQFTYVGGAHAAIDAHGDVTAAWVDTGTMKASVRRVASRAWSPVQTVATGSDCCSLAPSLAVDTRGSAIAAWVANGQIFTSTRRAAANDWSAPSRISRASEHAWTVAPTIGIGPKGVVVIAWRGEQVIEAAIRSAGGAFGPVRDVSQAGVEILEAPALAVDAAGDAVAVWESVRSVLPRYSRSAYLETARYRR